MTVEKKRKTVIGVVGAGLIGKQISSFLLSQGYVVILKTRDPSNQDCITEDIIKNLFRIMRLEPPKSVLDNLKIVFDYDKLSSCSIIIEAVSEDSSIKSEVFKQLSNSCRNSIVATNTSSISIDELGQSFHSPDMFMGLHFFNPVHKMPLVEIIKGKSTSNVNLAIAKEFIKDLEKVPVFVKDRPGFVVNRLLLPQINDAIKMLEEGVASKDDIDCAVKLGLNHPMGPLRLADLIGLDVCLSILEVLGKSGDCDYNRPAETLVKMVKEGNIGVKSGKGFYQYEG